MRKQYALVEDIIKEELLVEYYLKKQIEFALTEDRQILDEGLASLATVAKSWPKIKNAIATIVSYCKNADKIALLKNIITKINSIKSYNPAKIAKWLIKENSGAAKSVRLTTAAQKEVARKYGIMTDYVCDCAGYFWDATFTDTFNQLKSTIGLMYTTVKTIISFFGPIGQLVSSALDAAESITVNLLEGVRDWMKIVYDALNSVLRGLVGFGLDDIENQFNLSSVGEYGGAKGKALKDALAMLNKVRYNLKNTAAKYMDEKTKYIACVYRGKRTYKPSELNTTKKFCNDVLNLEVPTYEQAMKKWPGINRAKDDGTYASYIFKNFPWNVLASDQKSVAGWFSKSCNVASMTLAQLKQAFAKLPK